MKPLSTYLLAGVLASTLLSATAYAQSETEKPDDATALQELVELEKSLRNLAEQTIPKTVLVKATRGGAPAGSGSGAIISQDGYILTCTHVVEIGDGIEIVTSDGKKYKGKLLGRNNRQDYALVKIEAKGLASFKLGDSDTVKKGDWVAALGHPGGPYRDVQPAFAAGRVRGLDVKLPVGLMKKYYNHAIMTDVPIFAGDSGGPLVNQKGELIGINGAIVMINEMAFAVPMNQIKAELDDLKQGKVIEGEPPGPNAMAEMQKVISPEDYKKMQARMFKNFGKLFGENSPLGDLFGGKDNPLAKLFGGKPGEGPDFGKLFGGEMPDFGKLFGGKPGEGPDMQEMFGKLFGGGKPGEGMPDMQKMLEQMFGGKPGEGAPDMQKMLEKMFGGGKPGEGAPDLGKMFEKMFGGGKPGEGMPDMKKMLERLRGGQEPKPAPAAGKRPYLGFKIADASKDVDGLLVEELDAEGPAAKAGLKKGDMIIAAAGREVTTVAALRKALRGKKPGDAFAIKVLRTEFVEAELVERTLMIKFRLGAR